jgi:hypothetical protein
MRIFKTLLIVVILACIIHPGSYAQQIYRTLEGTMIISMQFNDTVLRASSHQLIVKLNYETGEIQFRIPYDSFRTGNDSIDLNLMKLTDRWMEFNGKLGIPYINTKSHPQQKFDATGTMLSAVPPTSVIATGTIDHISSEGYIACVLNLTIQFSLSSLNIQQAFYNASDLIQIDIQQSVLKRVND